MLCALLFNVGVSGMTHFFFSLSQREGGEFDSMSGGFTSTLLFKETFGEDVLKDSAKSPPPAVIV